MCLPSFHSPTRRSLISTLFPYTTLFRSSHGSFVVRIQLVLKHYEKTQGFFATTLPFSHTYSGVPYIRAVLRASLAARRNARSEEHTSELQSHSDIVCRLLLEKKKPTEPS